ncbi:putative leucine-rich repeat receptor-like serine/threonine-protein kinase At2g14440 [Andrographis paniculata]|uniref:putative leucine-rich repeat receptor-like serine/threonine-protein kinase At2g14440 n=1 Tax=Andrographis paniculata TaxID=175694 RepID=UPI0021E9249A|nr:putative leucine-rich repeat receptor-like serine/threonine-protein kinase At2g14440 [Andrographis paniculata]
MLIPLVFALLLWLPISTSQSLRGVFLDCGASISSTLSAVEWVPDSGYISAGESKVVPIYGLLPTLTTVRTFPLQGNVFKKFCYEVPVDRTKKYMVRTAYYYGGVNGNDLPPVFDLMVDGTFWTAVNTTEDYAAGNLSYYEGIFLPAGKNLSVCLAANTYTDSDPFISALEVVPLLDQLYNSTDFKVNAMTLMARNGFGHDGPVIGYPDDQFNRYWEPYGRDAFPQSTSQNLGLSGIWNLPPPKLFQTRLARNLPEPLTLLWPMKSIPSDKHYYIALYFADDQTSSSSRSARILDITINGIAYYNNLSLTPAGVVVFANDWPLSGDTNLTLSPSPGSTAGPLINAGEVFRLIPAGGKTLARDVIAMINLRKSFLNPPADWNGDPCLPNQYPWTGVSCSEGPRIRIVSLNLTGMAISGSISPSISRMTALNTILLGSNSLSGAIPDMSSLKGLQILHLEDNQLTGMIPPSLGNLQNLRELFLQNNNLTGQVPSNLKSKPGLIIRYSPGNPLLIP